MARMTQNPRYNVISMRISDEEQLVLDQIMRTTHQNTSEIMRAALMSLIDEYTVRRIGRKAA